MHVTNMIKIVRNAITALNLRLRPRIEEQETDFTRQLY